MKETKETKFSNPPLPPSPRSSQINRKNCGIFSIRCDRHVHFGTAWSFPQAKVTLKTQSARSIQSFFRMWMRRDHLNRLRSERAQRQELMYQAQIRIRKSWRAYSLRNYICRETRRKKCDSAARKIQRSIRDRKRRLEPLLKREKMCPQHWIRRKISPTKIVYEHLLTRRKTRAKPKTFLKSGGRVRFMPQDTVSNIPVWTQFWSSKAAVSMFYIHRLGKFSRTKPKDVDTILHDGKKRFVKL